MPKNQTITIQLEQKNASFELKSVDADLGIIKGYLSVFNNIDSQKDRVRPGAFKKTINDALQRKSNQGKKYLYPVLWMHEPEKPIGGVIDALEDKYGLLITAQLDISTNDQGIPLNPLATSVFSGLKQGYIDELSIGYKAIQKSYDAQGVRDLTEIQLFEASVITSLFASNPDAQVTSVKSLEMKSDFPLADKATPWSKSKAIKDIEKATNGDWGAAANKYFFWNAATPSVEADHKFPFVASVGGTMKAIPRAIFNAAARLESAKGVDVDSIKARMEPYYAKLGMTPPWKNKEKSMSVNFQTKDFNDRYREQCIQDWLYSDFRNLTNALQSAIIDIFRIGDEPEPDLLNTILNGVDNGSDDPGNKIGFIQALQDYIQKGIDLDVSNYLQASNSSSPFGYMSRHDTLEAKEGRTVSTSNAERMKSHVDSLMQCKAMIDTVAQDMQAYITGNQPFVDDSGKSRPRNAPGLFQPSLDTEESVLAELEAGLIAELSH